MPNHMENTTPSSNPSLSFEEAFQLLEETAQSLEAGNLSLNEATRLYENGMSLAKLCNQLLNATQLKITELKSAYSDSSPLLSSTDENDIDPG